MILHTVNSSPFKSQSLKNCIKLLAESDVVLLIEDAVVAAQAKHELYELLQQLAEQQRLFVLSSDLEARGLTANIGKRCSYQEFVELACECKSQIAW